MATSVTQEALEAAHCWEPDDRVPGSPAMTEFRRRVRLHQAHWREAQGHPIGTQPILVKPGRPHRLVGSRIPLEYAAEHGANFVTQGAWAAARERLARREPHQSLDRQRLLASLQSSQALAFNLLGDISADLARADRVIHDWFPDAPGRVSSVRFAHSPGWLDPSYLNNLHSFDLAIELDLGREQRGKFAVNVNYRERNKAETPRPENLERYTKVAKRSAVFAPGAIETLGHRSDLCVTWLGHLLMHSMLQQADDAWAWGRYVAVHAADNVDAADACGRYRSLLADQRTYETLTVEQMIKSRALPNATRSALRDRYLSG